MVDESDIWRAANLLVKRHGVGAAVISAQRADELLAVGDVDGRAVWKRILAAVRERTRTKPAEGERVTPAGFARRTVSGHCLNGSQVDGPTNDDTRARNTCHRTRPDRLPRHLKATTAARMARRVLAIRGPGMSSYPSDKAAPGSLKLSMRM